MPSRKPVISIRRPQPEAVDRFVSGEAERSNVQAFRPPDVQAPVASAAQCRSVVARADGRVRRRMTVYLPPELARALKVRSASEGVDMSDLITEILTGAL